MIKYTFSANLSGKLDEAKVTIRDVSIITEGPARGHVASIDTKTLSGIFELTKGQVVKAYWTHGGMFSGDRLGEEVGLFSVFHLDTATKQLKANFQVLEAFRKTYAARYDYLFELADKAGQNFGVSIHFEGEAVWVLDTGAEVSADGAKPANALGEMPVVRVGKVLSADFVSDPAANAGGMFAQGKLTELLDLKQKLSGELAELVAKLTATDEQAKAKDAANAELAGKLATADKSLADERAAFGVKESEFTAQKTALDAKVAELNATVAALAGDAEARKTELATKENEFKAQLEAMNKSLISFGAVPVNIYSEVIDHKATFAAITDPAEKTRYFKRHKDALLAA